MTKDPDLRFLILDRSGASVKHLLAKQIMRKGNVSGMFGRVIETASRLNNLRRLHKGWIWNEVRRRRRRPVPPHVVGVLAIMKNESHAIDEWIEHYLSIGVDRIFLIDNGSTDDTVAKARRWVERGAVDLVIYPEQHRQQAHYWSAFQDLKISTLCEWLIIADLDEFWFCKSGERLSDYLRHRTEIDVIYANWSQFGSNGHDRQPMSIRTSFLMRSPELNSHTKCILRTFLPDRLQVIRVHEVRRANPFRTSVDNTNLQLNHYAAQSRDFYFKVKLARGDVFFSQIDRSMMEQRFVEIDAQATVDDRLLCNLVLQGRLGRE